MPLRCVLPRLVLACAAVLFLPRAWTVRAPLAREILESDDTCGTADECAVHALQTGAVKAGSQTAGAGRAAFEAEKLTLHDSDVKNLSPMPDMSKDGSAPVDNVTRQKAELLVDDMDDCGTCPASNESMVWNSQALACVCEVCAESTWSQVQLLCRRRCFYGDSNCAQCFPNGATVLALHPDSGLPSSKTMEEVAVGDLLLTEKGFSRVFACMDHASDVEVEYIEFETVSGHVLAATPDHIVYAHVARIPQLARSIVPGDILWTLNTNKLDHNGVADLNPSPVLRIRRVPKVGMHAPLTEFGSVVVNGVLASSYAHVKSLQWGERTLMTGHELSRMLHEPLRLACSAWSSLCGPDWHSLEGRHVWTQFIMDNFAWLQNFNDRHSDLQAALWLKPSPDSWLAASAQVVSAALLCLTCGPSLRMMV